MLILGLSLKPGLPMAGSGADDDGVELGGGGIFGLRTQRGEHCPARCAREAGILHVSAVSGYLPMSRWVGM